jgi:hypothetical protein
MDDVSGEIGRDVSEVFDRGIHGGTAGVNSAMWHTCTLCGACVVEREYGPPVNRRRHLLWHDGLDAVLSGQFGRSDLDRERDEADLNGSMDRGEGMS